MTTTYMYKRSGFTSADMLVGILVLGTVLGVAIPGCQRVSDDSARRATMNNLSQCAKAVHLCQDQYKKLPPCYGVYGAKTTPQTFHTHLLPFVDQNSIYSMPTPHGLVAPYLSTMDPTFTENARNNGCNFPVNIRLFYTEGGKGDLPPSTSPIYPKMPDSFPDGFSNTLLFATKYMSCGSNGGSWWQDPGNNAPDSPTAATFGVNMALWQQGPTQANCDPVAGTAVSFTKQVIHVALCDGTARTVISGISLSTWQAVHTPGGKDKVGADWVE